MEVPAPLEDVDGSSLAIALVVLRRELGALLAVPTGAFSPEASFRRGRSVGMFSSDFGRRWNRKRYSIYGAASTGRWAFRGCRAGRCISRIDEPILWIYNSACFPRPEPHGCSSGSRFGSADEADVGPETPGNQALPKQGRRKEAVPNGGGRPGELEGGETNSCIFGSVFGSGGGKPSSYHEPAGEPCFQNFSDGDPSGERPVQVISIAAATWFLRYEWITSSLNYTCDLLRRMPPPKSMTPAGPSLLSDPKPLNNRSSAVGEREEFRGGYFRPCEGDVGPEPGYGCIGESAGDRGPDPQSELGQFFNLQQRCSRPSSSTTRTGSAQGHFLHLCDSSYGTPHATSQTGRCAPSGVGYGGCHSPTSYVERYGGYGRSRDLGCLMWQVAILAMILDHLQNELQYGE